MRYFIIPVMVWMALVLSAQAGTDLENAIIKDWCLQDNRTEPVDEAYLENAKNRREKRLKTLKEQFPKWVFTKHYNFGGGHYTYTEGLSDAQGERHFTPGSSLCVLELNADGQYEERSLLSDKNGVLRDPVMSVDGKKIIFSWKKSDRLDDFHLYDYDLSTDETRQLTFGIGYADYEPCVTPEGDIVFNSTRCVQMIDCWWAEVSNLFRCDKDGRMIHRLTYDQVHPNWPTLMKDGRIIYTRWDYNDRGQIFPQGLFQMNFDGTRQTEVYGNNSYFPTSIMHTREIPNSEGQLISIFSGHHTRQYGKLGIIDPSKGRQENAGTQLIAPVRDTPADRVDAWGQHGDRFAYPYPINLREYVVSYTVNTEDAHDPPTPFDIYWMDMDGNRELLTCDPTISCHQAIPMQALDAAAAVTRESQVDVEKDYGIITMQDVYHGPGLDGVERGKAKTLRVIALDFRTTGIGANTNGGPAGAAVVITPMSIGNGSWDVKIPVGDTPIYEDGSASFKVPAKTPLYFQVLDENGHCIQSMRSWATLQPGEIFSCVGCHEDKNTVVQNAQLTIAMQKGPKELEPFYGSARGFSYITEIQPILDRHCVGCHQNADKLPPYVNLDQLPEYVSKEPGKDISPDTKPFSLMAEPVLDAHAKRYWYRSYLNLTNSREHVGGKYYMGLENDVVRWINAQEGPELMPAYRTGAAKSNLLKMLDPNLAEEGKTHNDIKLTREELDKIACWIDLLVPFGGDYVEGNAWNAEDWSKFRYHEAKRRDMDRLDIANTLRFVSHEKSQQSPPCDIEKPANIYRDLVLDNGVSKITTDSMLKLDFEKTVRTDQILVTVSPEIPDHLNGTTCTLICSNGYKQTLNLSQTGEKQILIIPIQEFSWLQLRDFSQPFSTEAIQKVDLEIFGINPTLVPGQGDL